MAADPKTVEVDGPRHLVSVILTEQTGKVTELTVPVVHVPSLSLTRVHLVKPTDIHRESSARSEVKNSEVRVREDNTIGLPPLKETVRPIYKPRLFTNPEINRRHEHRRKVATVRERERSTQLNKAFDDLGRAVGIEENYK